MFNLFNKKPKTGILTVSLNARLQPNDRHDLEDAFADFAQNQGIHAEIIGGGTLMADNGEVSQCDIELELTPLNDQNVTRVLETFTAMLAPKGSYAIRHDAPDSRIAFGNHEGLALYLNGKDLPEETYQNCDINHVVDECARLLEGQGMVNSHWQGATETALYMYGPSFSTMHQRIAPLLADYPLCQHCRVQQIA